MKKIEMRTNNDDGFTLVEALIASVVMALGLIAVITAVSMQTNILNKDREYSIASLAAQGHIELLRGRAFGNIVNSTFDDDEAPGLAYLHYGSGVGSGSVLVEDADFTADSNIKKVSVTVTWDSIDGNTRTKTLETLVTKNGINRQ